MLAGSSLSLFFPSLQSGCEAGSEVWLLRQQVVGASSGGSRLGGEGLMNEPSPTHTRPVNEECPRTEKHPASLETTTQTRVNTESGEIPTIPKSMEDLEVHVGEPAAFKSLCH